MKAAPSLAPLPWGLVHWEANVGKSWSLEPEELWDPNVPGPLPRAQVTEGHGSEWGGTPTLAGDCRWRCPGWLGLLSG